MLHVLEGWYEGRTTASGHEIRIQRRVGSDAMLWYLRWVGGDRGGWDYNHEFIRLVSVALTPHGFRAGWFRGAETEPYREEVFGVPGDLKEAIDAVISRN